MSRFSDFLDDYPTLTTKGNYSAGVRNFLHWKYGFELHTVHVALDTLKKQREEVEALVDRYFEEGNDYANDYKEYCKWVSSKYQPTTCQMYYTVMKQFFLFNDVDFTHKEKKSIKRQVPKGGPATKDVLPTRKNIVDFLNHASLKLRLLTVLLISSGLRIDEALSLKIGDVELHDTYGIIYVRNSKNGKSRTTFCSSECVNLILQWLKVHNDYKHTLNARISAKNNLSVSTEARNDLLFGFGDTHARDMLKRATEKAGLDQRDSVSKRRLIHFHVFRKYFETTCKTHIPSMFVEVWVGHQSEVKRAYDIPSIEKQVEIYLKVEPYLHIFDESAAIVEQHKKEIDSTKNEMLDIRMKNIEMRQSLDEMKKMVLTLMTEKITVDGFDPNPKKKDAIIPEDQLKNITK